jgi:capsid portal protein
MQKTAPTKHSTINRPLFIFFLLYGAIHEKSSGITDVRKIIVVVKISQPELYSIVSKFNFSFIAKINLQDLRT